MGTRVLCLRGPVFGLFVRACLFARASMTLAAIILGGSVAELLSAQSNSSSAPPLAPYHFEVASIKLNRTGGSSDADFLPGGRFRGRNLSVRKMIQMATMVEDNQIIGVPTWTDTECYDVDGKTISTEPVTQ